MSFPKKNTLAEITSIVEQIQSLLNRDLLSHKAKELGFTKKKGKLDAFDFVSLNLLGMHENGQLSSLTELCGHASSLGISIVKQSLNERYNVRSVALCKWLFEQVLYQKVVAHYRVEKLEEFNGLYVEDASSFQLPKHLAKCFKGFGGGSTGAAIKINCKMDLQSTNLRIRIKDGVDNDQNGITMGCPEKSLWLRDLGYYKVDELINLNCQKAYFVSRMPICSNAYYAKEGKAKFDLEEICSQLSDNEVFEKQVYLGDKQRFGCRMVIIKLPKAKAERRVKKLKKTKKAKGKKISQRRIILCAVNIFVTNLDAKRWDAKSIWHLYTIRWQIEIVFKAWKSILKLDKVKNVKEERILCQLYLQLVKVTLTTKLFRYFKIKIWTTQNKEISELKGSLLLKIWWTRILESINEQKEKMINIFAEIHVMLKKLAVKRTIGNKKDIFHICEKYT